MLQNTHLFIHLALQCWRVIPPAPPCLRHALRTYTLTIHTRLENGTYIYNLTEKSSSAPDDKVEAHSVLESIGTLRVNARQQHLQLPPRPAPAPVPAPPSTETIQRECF